MVKNNKKRFHRCSCCSNKAVWLHIPGRKGGVFYCDEHVPVGSTCQNYNLSDDGEPEIEKGEVAWWPKDGQDFTKINTERKPDSYFYQYLRSNGRLYPCCEYHYDKDGYEFFESVTITPTLSIRQALAKLTNSKDSEWLNDDERSIFKTTILKILQKSEKQHGFTNHNEFMTSVSQFVYESGITNFHDSFHRLKELLVPVRKTVFHEDWISNKF